MKSKSLTTTKKARASKKPSKYAGKPGQFVTSSRATTSRPVRSSAAVVNPPVKKSSTGTSLRRLPPMHPGYILKEVYMDPIGLSANQLGKDLNIHANRITRLINGQFGITAELATLLAARFKTSREMWMGLQSDYELEMVDAKVARKLKLLAPEFRSQFA